MFSSGGFIDLEADSHVERKLVASSVILIRQRSLYFRLTSGHLIISDHFMRLRLTPIRIPVNMLYMST